SEEWDPPGAVAKVRALERSAGFQPAVSPISNRQSVASPHFRENWARPQAGSTAIQQVGNLRYELVHSPRDQPPSHASAIELLFPIGKNPASVANLPASSPSPANQ